VVRGSGADACRPPRPSVRAALLVERQHQPVDAYCPPASLRVGAAAGDLLDVLVCSCFVCCMPKTAKTHVVYGLFAEGVNLPFYIGRACDFKNRMQCHENPPATEAHLAKSRKIKSLKDKGLSFSMKIGFTSSDFDAVKCMESDLINLFGRRDIGTGILMNHNDGGDGMEHIVWSEDARRRKSESMKGKKQPGKRRRKFDRNSSPIHCYRRDGTYLGTFLSKTEAVRLLGVNQSAVGAAARGSIAYTRSSFSNEVFQFSYQKTESRPPLVGALYGDEKPVRVYVRSQEWRDNISKALSRRNEVKKQQGGVDV